MQRECYDNGSSTVECGFVYDFDLHMRFMRSAIEAWFGYASAGAAALQSFQEASIPSEKGNGAAASDRTMDLVTAFWNPTTFWNPMSFWTAALGQSPVKPQAVSDFAAPFFQFSAQPPSAFWPWSWGASAAPVWPNAGDTARWQSGWTDMLQACSWAWPQIPATAYAAPMTFMLMWAGFPYRVAEPAARANAASMDAANAAREGFDRMMSSFRTDGGHAFVPVQYWQKLVLLCAAPWLAAMPGSHFG